MDQLHLDLWWRGINIAQDAGTYLYSGAPPWDNPLVATRVHNTVTVDGDDQMTRGGRFLVLDCFPAYSQTSFESDPVILQRVRAYHKGYRGILHERVVTVHTGGRWVIEDRLKASSAHVYRLHWLLPDWEREVRGIGSGEAEGQAAQEGPMGQRVEVRIRSPHGWLMVLLSADPPSSDAEFSIARAGHLVHGEGEILPFEGWVSPTYGVKMPALSVTLEVRARRGMTFTTEIAFPE
jgi:hypothetical protein